MDSKQRKRLEEDINNAVKQALADDQAPTVTVNEMNQWLDNVLADDGDVHRIVGQVGKDYANTLEDLAE